MNFSKPLLGIGAGGHAKSVLGVLLDMDMPQWSILGLLDESPSLHGTRVLGIPVLGGDDQLGLPVYTVVRHVFLGIGTPKDTSIRQRIWYRLQEQGLEVIDIVSPTAILSRHATYGNGLTCLPGAIVQAGTIIGDNVLVNSGAIVEHDCHVYDHVHIASGATLAGNVIVEAGALIGAGACIRPGTRVGANAIVGCGSVVVQDVPPSTTVVGNPARPICRERDSWTTLRAS